VSREFTSGGRRPIEKSIEMSSWPVFLVSEQSDLAVFGAGPAASSRPPLGIKGMESRSAPKFNT